ncbi:hypothetical protein FB451DRAFT_1239979 [Mycena latifolia]|nr:hypothetical protein FB451DRAFT_1239979 [Mycena latifolia]
MKERREATLARAGGSHLRTNKDTARPGMATFRNERMDKGHNDSKQTIRLGRLKGATLTKQTTHISFPSTMDPLRISDLPLAQNWATFTPDMKGHIPPQQLDLHPRCDDIEDQIRQFTSTDYMRDNNAPFLGLSVAQDFPTTSLEIHDETFTVPLPPREIAYLTRLLGNANAPRHSVSGGEVTLSNACHAAISVRETDVLGKLKAIDGNIGRETTLAALDVFKAGSHDLSTAPTDENHFATVFAILPAFTDSAIIRVHATHNTTSSVVNLPADLRQSVSAIGIYAGVTDARIEVGAGAELICLTYHVRVEPHDDICVVPRLEYLSGALPPLRDAFCLWRHALNTGTPAPALMLFFLSGTPEAATAFQDEDATLLCHLAPLAKAYGFNVYIGALVHTMSTEQEVFHPYKEYFGLDADLDPSELEMSDDPEVEYTWAGFRTLGGVNVVQPALVSRVAQMITTRPDLQADLMDVDMEEDYEIEHDSLYSATVTFTHTRTPSILFIAP